MDTFDIVILLGKNDECIIEKQLEYTRKNIIGYRNIYIIPADRNINIDGCIMILEDIFPFSVDTIRDIYKVTEKSNKTWYLQQLLKLYACVTIPDILDKYLVIDADTFFINPTYFVENGKCLYNYNNYPDSIHLPYFQHIKNLFPEINMIEYHISAVTHHMIFETKYIREMFKKSEDIYNEPFYVSFLKSVPEHYQESAGGASEYELYFNYMINYHLDKIKLRKLSFINAFTLRILKNTELYDYISYHWYSRND